MKIIGTVLATACAALALAGTASAGLQIGVVEDGVRGANATNLLSQMNDVGLAQVRVTVLWDPAAPMTIPDQAQIEQMLPFAQARGMRVVFAVYPARPFQAPRTAAQVSAFAAFTAHLARTFPSVKEFIVGNEPNQTRFWQPQFGAGGGACVAFTRVLAASYDALKGVDPANRVIGVGLSPRGNDDPRAKDNVSHSPVSCLRDMGAAYRGLARARPLMDELSFHPYPKSDRDPLMKGYRWPNAGVPNLGRIKQAFWDAFRGTRQPLFAEGGAAGRVKFRLDEVGWQVGVHPSARAAYAGVENIQPTDESSQARIYAQLIRYLACDPSVSSLLFSASSTSPISVAGRRAWSARTARCDRRTAPSRAPSPRPRAAAPARSTRGATRRPCSARRPSSRRWAASSPRRTATGPSTPPPRRTRASMPASFAQGRAARRSRSSSPAAVACSARRGW